MQDFVKRLHSSGQRWIPITDAGVAAAEGYGAYEKGLAMDVFVKDHKGQPYMGQVRGGWHDTRSKPQPQPQRRQQQRQRGKISFQEPAMCDS